MRRDIFSSYKSATCRPRGRVRRMQIVDCVIPGAHNGISFPIHEGLGPNASSSTRTENSSDSAQGPLAGDPKASALPALYSNACVDTLQAFVPAVNLQLRSCFHAPSCLCTVLRDLVDWLSPQPRCSTSVRFGISWCYAFAVLQGGKPACSSNLNLVHQLSAQHLPAFALNHCRDEYSPEDLVGGPKGHFRVGRFEGSREDVVLVGPSLHFHPRLKWPAEFLCWVAHTTTTTALTCTAVVCLRNQ